MTQQRNLLLLILLSGPFGCGERQPSPHSGTTLSRDSADSAFTKVQARGKIAMGVDQYTSAHSFEPLPDGGRITLTRDPRDTAGGSRIRAHMQEIADSFSRGNFALPGFVHDRQVPGTAVMRARRALISYTPDSMPGGGQLRITSRDPGAVAAIHDFLAFQRRDHRTEGHGHP